MEKWEVKLNFAASSFWIVWTFIQELSWHLRKVVVRMAVLFSITGLLCSWVSKYPFCTDPFGERLSKEDKTFKTGNRLPVVECIKDSTTKRRSTFNCIRTN